jgi:hypothetical protein
MASYEFSQYFPNRELSHTELGFEVMWRQYVKDFLEIVSGNTSSRGRDPVSMRVKATNLKVTMLTKNGDSVFPFAECVWVFNL